MIELISVPGCGRIKSVKQLAKEYETSLIEKNLFKLLLDSNQKKNKACLQDIASFYNVSLETLKQNPSLVSRPFVRVSQTLSQNQRKFLEALRQRPFYPSCSKQCLKRSVCPAHQRSIEILDKSEENEEEIKNPS